MVPDGTNKAASLPRRAATRSWSRWTVGSSSKTSSPTSAACMAARMAGVGLVTVSLRRSIRLSAMRCPRYGVGRLLLFCRGRLLTGFEEPAAVQLAQIDPAVRHVLELGRSRGIAGLPSAFQQEALKLLDTGPVVRQLASRLCNHVLEFAAMHLLHALIHPLRIRELGQQIVDLAGLNRLEDRREGLLGRRLGIGL